MEFELTRNITIGQYLPTGSTVHRFDPRLKLISFTALVLSICFLGGYWANVLALVFCALLFPIARIPLRYGLSGVKPAIPFIVLLAVLQLLFYGKGFGAAGRVYFHWGFIWVTAESVRLVVISALRFVEVIFLSSVLTLSTSITELTHGLERVLMPLRHVRFPVHAFALMITIAVRFVPTFALEMEKMMKAQASRGAEFGTGQWWRIVQRTRDTFPILIPLFNIALARAEDLVLAMESRCYTPTEDRTSFKRYTAKPKDWGLFVVALTISVGFFLIRFW